MRKHHLSRACWLTGLALALLLALLLCAAATAEEPIPIDEAHFGDPEFCKAVSEWIDQENETGYKDGSLDQNEISNGKKLRVVSKKTLKSVKACSILLRWKPWTLPTAEMWKRWT